MTTGDRDAPLRLVPHVHQRMQERGISEDAIRWILANYHTQRPTGTRRGTKPAVIFVGAWGGRNLRVYVERGSQPPRIMTVAWED